MSKPIWSPSQAVIESSNMYAFMQHINQNFQLSLNSYQGLYQWTLDHPESFWQHLAKFYNIKFHKNASHILSKSDKFYQNHWFEGATLNFAENLLTRDDDGIAIISTNESLQTRYITYKELSIEVKRLANAFIENGIKSGDRIAGILPNIPEAVIAMLASTSIGAIWSVTAPEFGLKAISDRLDQIEPKLLIGVSSYQYKKKRYDLSSKLSSIASKDYCHQLIVIGSDAHKPNLQTSFVWYHDYLSNEQTIDMQGFDFNHPLTILFSSGTTGKPKCITHGIGGTLLQHVKELGLHTNIKPSSCVFYYTTCGWMMWNWLISSLCLQATVVLYDGHPNTPTIDVLFQFIEKFKINIFGTSASYIHFLAKHQVIPKNTHDLSSLQTILSTGSPLSEQGFEYVYQQIKSDISLSSISGGTDIISCFALGNPMLPIYPGKLQCRGLAMDVDIFNNHGQSIVSSPGELVCKSPFPSMPVYFWGDPDFKQYHNAYFNKYPNIWAHGDFAELSEDGQLTILGRSDATLNAGGVRIGTAELYRTLDAIEIVDDAIAINQIWQDDMRIILFVKCPPGMKLDTDSIADIKKIIRALASPRHVPAKIIQIDEIPTTINGKKVELAVFNQIHRRPIENIESLSNPTALEQFNNMRELNEP